MPNFLKELLDQSVTNAEVLADIKSLRSNKQPGPDGFMVASTTKSWFAK